MPINAKLATGLVVSGLVIQDESMAPRVFPLDAIVYRKKKKKPFATPRRAICRPGFIGWLTLPTGGKLEVRFTGTAWVENLPNHEKRMIRAETKRHNREYQELILKAKAAERKWSEERELDLMFPSREWCQGC